MINTSHCCYILPQFVLLELAEQGGAELRQSALQTLVASAQDRSTRSMIAAVTEQLSLSSAELFELAGAAAENKTVYDAQTGLALPGERMRGETDPAVTDTAVNEAFGNADATHDFYRDVFERESLDGKGMELISSVHYRVGYDNAFWNGMQMVYGDGSGKIFVNGGLTKDIAVSAHEITHGVVQFTANLRYSKQSGALNESMADVFGSMVKQYVAKENAEDADWLIGEGILGSALQGDALRSLKAPGTAFNLDHQPAHMRDYQDLPDDSDPRNDHGGVHINSGIPNHAFYLAATKLGGHSWERAGSIWYDALRKHLKQNSDFADAARATIKSAGSLYGEGKDEEKAVREAWQEVGVL